MGQSVSFLRRILPRVFAILGLILLGGSHSTKAIEIPASLQGQIPAGLLDQMGDLSSLTGGSTTTTAPSLPTLPSTRAVNVGEGFQSKHMKRILMKELSLNVQSAELLYEQKKSTYENLASLVKGSFVSPQEVNDADRELKAAEESLEKARIELRKQRLEFLNDSVHLSILSAQKISLRDGRTRVEFILKNTSDLNQVLFLAGDILNKQQATALLRITDLLVRVESGAIGVGDPYEIKVRPLNVGETIKLSFFLQVDTETVTLVMQRNNKNDSRTLFLERTSEEGGLRITTANFSLEGDLGGEVLYSLTLQNLEEKEKTVALKTLKLPENYQARFEFEGAQVRQLQMGFGVPTMDVKLRVFVPENIDGEFLDKPVSLVAVAGPPGVVNAVTANSLDEASSTQADMARQSLFVVPTGTPGLGLSTPTLYLELTKNQENKGKIIISNLGTVPLENIEVTADAPKFLGFKLSKTTVASLNPREELSLPFDIKVEESAKDGEYEIRLQSEVKYRGKTVKTQEKNLRVKVSAPAEVGKSLGRMAMILVVLIGIVAITIKVSRR